MRTPIPYALVALPLLASLACTNAAVNGTPPTGDAQATDDAVTKTDAPVTTDVPETPDVPVSPDVPETPDVPITPDVPPSCPTNQIRCMDRCVDAQNDPAHCGNCATACATGEACVAGICQLRCPGGQTACAGRCIDLQTDRANCGACGTACPTGQVCSMGACTIECAAPTILCTTGAGDAGVTRACANTQTDRAHCGACGTACGQGEICEGGRCVLTCPEGQSPCGGRCVSTSADPANCGMCGRACSMGQTCANGTCRDTCDPGITDCGGGRCRNIQTDPQNCGACGRMCPAPAGGEATCALGACGIRCSAGFGDCDNDPANGCEVRLTDPANCGACGRTCSFPNASATCAAGACALGTCNTGFLDCDRNPANGCEVNARTDRVNCGACGTMCNSMQSCSDGVCGLFCSMGSVLCNGRCTNTQNDPQNCGACGGTCTAPPNMTPVCAAGRCDAVCSAGFASCDGNAGNGCEVNTNTSVAHCGACGRACSLPGATAVCSGGSCAVGACNSGLRDCDGNPTNGCEVDVRSNNAHCGACGVTCAGTCSNGECLTVVPRTYSAFFSGSTTVLAAACSQWRTWRTSLRPGAYSRITITGSSNGATVSCTEPSAVQQIATGLRNLTSFHVTCSGRTWSLCATRYDGEFWVGAPSLCSGANCPSPGTIIRPCFGGSNNYNGVLSSTCPGPTQTITIEVR